MSIRIVKKGDIIFMDNNFINNLTFSSGFHTISIKSTEVFENSDNYKFIKRDYSRLSHADSNEPLYSYKLNPSLLRGTECYSLSDFKSRIDEILCYAQINDYNVQRVDFRFDNYELEYKELFKLNKLLILCLTTQHNLRNNFVSTRIDSSNPVTAKAKNTVFEVEYYDKQSEREVNGFDRGNIKSRLELRRMGIDRINSINSYEDVVYYLLNQIESANDYYNQTLEALNNKLLIEYKQAISNNAVVNYNEFIRKNEDKLFSRKQVIRLLESMDISNAVSKADHFKTKNITYVSESNLKTYIDTLSTNMNIFLAS